MQIANPIKYTKTTTEGSCDIEITYLNNMKHGVCKIHDKKTDTYKSIPYMSDMIHGIVYTLNNKWYQQTPYYQNRKHGIEYIQQHTPYVIESISWENGHKCGCHTIRQTNNNVTYNCNYMFDVKDGFEETYSLDNEQKLISSAHYVNGKKHGIENIWSDEKHIQKIWQFDVHISEKVSDINKSKTFVNKLIAPVVYNF